MSNCIRSVWKVHISYAHSSLCSNQICAEEKAMFLNFHSSRNLKQCTSHEISLTGVARRCQSLRNLKHTSKKQDLYLFVGLWNACFTKIQVITSKILRCYSENIQQFQYSIHKIQPTKFENKKKKNNEKLIPHLKDWDWLHRLPLSSAARRWTRLQRPQHRIPLLPFPAQHMVAHPQVTN